MARNIRKHNRHATNSQKLKQSVLTIGNQKTEGTVKCSKCHMTFSSTSAKDALVHDKYHSLHLHGRKWSSNWGDTIEEYGMRTIMDQETAAGKRPRDLTFVSTPNTSAERIVQISKNRKSEVQATLDVLRIVNEELHAPHNENYFWSHVAETEGEGKFHRKEGSDGKAFVYVSEGRAVGVVTVEFLKLEENRGRWMVYDTASIVPGVIPSVKVGISRIWVCKQQRGRNIATKLLETARLHSIPGMVLAKWELAWSQPSESGGKLAQSYNSVKHERSGKTLIPCYI
ncbi:LAFA_0G15148g1_1 [Lachancea sp. 'fantastica']|nr:LAFA_0G15148g1_1 [Lachancea sp. 'fantastica']